MSEETTRYGKQPHNSLEERMHDALCDNKSDESDEESWITSNDYYKVAEACAQIAREEMKREAMAFAEWIQLHEWEMGNLALWYKDGNEPESLTTSELYTLYTEQKQA